MADACPELVCGCQLFRRGEQPFERIDRSLLAARQLQIRKGQQFVDSRMKRRGRARVKAPARRSQQLGGVFQSRNGKGQTADVTCRVLGNGQLRREDLVVDVLFAVLLIPPQSIVLRVRSERE